MVLAKFFLDRKVSMLFLSILKTMESILSVFYECLHMVRRLPNDNNSYLSYNDFRWGII